MSYDIDLVDSITEKCVTVPKHEEGGVYAVGGITDASLSITYNYAQYYFDHIDSKDGIRWLYGKKAKNCIKGIEKAVMELGTVRNDDYWKGTPGNAGYALSILLAWARLHPEATFQGD